MLSSGGLRIRTRAPFRQGLRKIDPSQSLMLFAEVVIDTTTKELGERLFTYHVPDHLRNEVFVGSQVLIPFGNQDLTSGYVVALHDDIGATQFGAQRLRESPVEEGAVAVLPKTRPIVEVLESEPLFDPSYVSLLHWVADYFAASIAEVIAAAVPSDIGPRMKRIVRLLNEDSVLPLEPQEQGLVNQLMATKTKSISVKTLKQRTGLTQSKFYAAIARLRQSGVISVENENESKTAPKTVQCVIATGDSARTKKQEEILSALSRNGGQMAVSELSKTAGTTSATIRKMCVDGVLQVVQQEVIRDPLMALVSRQQKLDTAPELTDHQSLAFNTLRGELLGALEADPVPPSGPWLLHGVTGSGKTEIYMRLIQETLDRDRSALMLVPEISLTPQLAQRLVGRFGNLVAVWHSALSAGERFDTWRRLRAGQARVLLGARSAVLAALPDVGLIILDEEHDSSYKQSSPSPRYHARTVAVERGARESALVLLGSATPDVATHRECRSANRIVELPERVFKQALPKSTLVDMRLEFEIGSRGIFSAALEQAIAERLRKQEQVILLINRRGYASHVLCRACGYVVRCRNCSVSLVYHQSPRNPEGHLICHHCAFTTTSWQICPACQSPFIKQFGLGTQRVEEEVRELFPSARLLRLDSDITSKRGASEEVFRTFAEGGADILIGTQIVAKGLDIARVTLVGVLAADAAFNLPDYRTVERGFQLLTQVSGRAGRGEHPGEVLLQTYNLDMPALTLARKQDYATFVEQELSSRETFEYPPFSQIIRVVVAGELLEQVEFACEQLAEELSTHLENDFTEHQIKILGPAPCLIERLRSKYRFHLIIKNLAGRDGQQAITRFLRSRRSTPGLQIAVDVDAVDLI